MLWLHGTANQAALSLSPCFYPFFHLFSLWQHLLHPPKDLWVGSPESKTSNRQGLEEDLDSFSYLSFYSHTVYSSIHSHTLYSWTAGRLHPYWTGGMRKGCMWSVQCRRIKTALGIRVCSGDPRKVISLHEEKIHLWNTQSFSCSRCRLIFAGGSWSCTIRTLKPPPV